MIVASLQVAVGGLQMLSVLGGKLANKKSTVSPENGENGESHVDKDGDDLTTPATTSMSVLGLLSFISGVIMLCVYTSGTHNATIYHSFQAAVYMNVINFAAVSNYFRYSA